MGQFGPVFLGISGILLGVGFFALAFFLMRALPRVQPLQPDAVMPPVPPGVNANNDAVLLIQSGGRVAYINHVAREWLGLLEEEPNLERLARRARPSQSFLGLCASEGQARFSLNGIFVEGTSYFIPYNGSGAVLVTFHRPHVKAIAAEEGTSELPGTALDIFAELSQLMSSSLDLKKTLGAVLEGIERVIPSDFSEVTLWDSDKKQLIPYRFVGLAGLDRHMERAEQIYDPKEGYTGFLIASKSPLMIGNVDAYRPVRPMVDRKQYPFNSYLGVPLLAGNEVIGTLELASLSKDGFTQNDRELLRILSGQAAIAIQNANSYEEEQRRVLELSGLAQLAHAASALYDPKDLFGRLVDSIRPLLDVGVIGFWIVDENKHTLIAQAPFVGIPIQFLEHYSLSIPPDSKAEEIWRKQEVVVTSDALADENMKALGFDRIALAAGYSSSVLIPLASGGRQLGYLQAASKRDGTGFDPNDLRLLTIVGSQAAIIIENAILAQLTQKRAQRAEALRRIASLTASAATRDEILTFSLLEVGRLMNIDFAAIFLLDEHRGEMNLHKESVFGISPEDIRRIASSAPEMSEARALRIVGMKHSYLTADASADTDALQAYRMYVESLGIRAMIAAPLTIRERTVGEVMIGSKNENLFDRNDLILVDTVAGQLASAIEQSSITAGADEPLRRRVDQLTSLNKISRELNTSLDLMHLMNRVFDELLKTTRAACGSILLFELADDGSKSTKIFLQVGEEHPPELSAAEVSVLEREEPLVIGDYDKIEDQPPHEGIHSSLIVPIAYQEQVAGMIHLHARGTDRFDETAVDIARSLAVQAAIAMGNSQRYQQQVERNELLSRRVETLSQLFQTTAAMHVDQPLSESLENIAYGIQDSTPFTIVMISVLDPENRQLVRVASAGLTLDQMREAFSRKLAWQAVEQLMRPEFRIGRSYFIPADKSPILPPDIHFIYSSPVSQKPPGNDTWHNDDFMLLPVMDASGNPLGMISVDNPRNGLRPDRPTIETLELFANQAALAIEGFKKLEVFKKETDQIKTELNRSRQSAADTTAHLPAMLHKDLEQTLTIQRLSVRARRVRSGLEMAEILNRQPDRQRLLETFGQELVSDMDFDAVLVGEMSQGAPRITHVLGAVPAGVNPETLLGQRNPLRQALQSQETILVSNLVESDEWRGSPLLQALDTRSFICIPIPREDAEPGKELEAVVMAVRQTPYEQFTKDDQLLFALIARQVAIALQNLRLLTETNRRLQEVNALLEFSRKLGSFDPRSILQTLANSAMGLLPESNTCLVALWDAKIGALVPQVAVGYHDSQAIMEIVYHSGEALPGQAYETGKIVRLDEVDFARDYQLPSDNLIRYRNATQGKLPISTLIVPIGGSGETGGVNGQRQAPLGVLVLDSYKTAGAFNTEDAALITSLAQQTALTLENARLFQASEQRAEQLRSLTDVAATITSSLQSSELIQSLLTQAQAIIPYDTGTLWLRQGQRLAVRAARGFADSEERVGISVEVEDSLLLKEMISSGKPISVPDVRLDERFPSLIEPTYLSWVGVPLVSKGQVVGVIALEKIEPGFFTVEHLQAVTTFAGQAAVALENAKLYEESVDRAAELDERSQKLATLNRLSAELSGSLDPSYIVKTATQELLKSAQCSGVSAVLFDSEGTAWLSAEAPQTSEMLPVQMPESPLFKRLEESLGSFNFEDISSGFDPDIAKILGELSGYLSSRKTCSLLILPLATGSNLHGVVFLQNEKPYHYSPDEIELARTICNQVAVAVQNARLFGETRQRGAELATLYDLGVNVAQVFERQQLIDLTYKNVGELLGVNSIALVMREENNDLVGYLMDDGDVLAPVLIPPSNTSFSQHVLATGTPLLIGDLQRDQLPVEGFVVGDPSRSWIGVPMVVRGAAVGVLSVQSGEPDKFNQSHVRLLQQVSNQLAVALDNSRLFATVQNYATELEHRVVERTSELEKEHHRTETLLGIITELSTSLDMDLVLNRTLSLINESTGAQHGVIMLVNPEDNMLFLRASLGYAANLPKGGRPTKMKYNQGLAGWVISKRQAVLVDDLTKDERWVPNEEQPTDHRSAMAVPLMMGEEVLGALLLYNKEKARFSNDQLDLVQATAKQIAVSINNSSLYTLIRDQAERLGDMLRRQHVETSRSQAILEAVADGVLVTDANRVITLFNASAEQILSLSRQQVLGHTLEHFVGLFGKEGQAWMDTIRNWSENPHSLGDGQSAIYTEQIELDDRRVVSVHLAPVRLRNDFLGTVSIFQDITHQVEVDRLKSEFVATVSHELRTPMTSIKGYVDVMLMGVSGQLNEQQNHFLQIVKSNTERLAILVNDLLDISRIEAGKVELSLQPIDLGDVIRKSAEDLALRCDEEGKPMEIQTDLPADIPRAFGDPERVRQIVDNLLENAYYYTPENGKITVSLSHSETEVQVDVKDNGIGIPEEEQLRIFERFYRGEDPLVLATSGTGLGLSIVARLIEMHKGRIWVSSAGVRGLGSTFSFTLPQY